MPLKWAADRREGCSCFSWAVCPAPGIGKGVKCSKRQPLRLSKCSTLTQTSCTEILMAKNMIYAAVAGPVVITAAYGISSWLMTDSAGEQVPADMSLAFGVLLWVGAPIAFVAALPILTGIFNALTTS